MSLDCIIRAIIDCTHPNYSDWHIGVTVTPEETKQQIRLENRSLRRWKHWPLPSLEEAKSIESFFSKELGMKWNQAQANENGSLFYIYIY